MAEGMNNIEHLMILMMENRSFDHYFGSYSLPEEGRSEVNGLKAETLPLKNPVPFWNMHARSSRVWRTFNYSSALLLVAFACLLGGCGPTRLKEANAVAKQGSDTAAALEGYYTTLNTRSIAFEKFEIDRETQGAARIDRLQPGELIVDREDAANSGGRLAARLKAPRDGIDRFVEGWLTAGTRSLLAAYDGVSEPTAELKQGICDDINVHLQQDTFYQSTQVFADSALGKIKLSEPAQTLIDQYLYIGTYTLENADTKGQRRLTLNRLILACAYPKLIRASISELFERQQAALRARQSLAHTLNGLTESLQKLTSADPSAAVKDATKALQTEIETVNNHPLKIASPNPLVEKALSTVDTTNLLGKMAQQLTEIEQVKDFRKNLPNVDGFLQSVEALFHAETPVYTLISAQYIKEAGIQDLGHLKDPSVAIVTDIDPKSFDPYKIPVEVKSAVSDQAEAKRLAALTIEQAT